MSQVCAPARMLNCSTSYVMNGACYTSSDYGSTWSTSTRQATKREFQAPNL